MKPGVVDTPHKKVPRPGKKIINVECKVWSGCRCNICGGFFPDGDDICGLGRHQIGQVYPVEVDA